VIKEDRRRKRDQQDEKEHESRKHTPNLFAKGKKAAGDRVGGNGRVTRRGGNPEKWVTCRRERGCGA